MATEHTVGFEPADRLAKDREGVRRRFWIKLKRVVSRLPFAEDLLAAYYCAFDSETPLRSSSRKCVMAIGNCVAPTPEISTRNCAAAGNAGNASAAAAPKANWRRPASAAQRVGLIIVGRR